ncbi:MAG: PaaI family thioesterase, partial [Planctomycetes bacterium]|nr:PaaI family thioesterase [Planctomycetota bacterium]
APTSRAASRFGMTPLDRQGLLRLAEVYHTSPIGRTTGMRIDFDAQGCAAVSWSHRPDYDHALDEVHGGLIATMLDNAGWFTAAAAHGEWVVTAEFHVRLLRGTTGEDLRAEGRIIRRGSRLTVAAMDVCTASGIHIATGTGSFCPTGRPLPGP